MNINKINKYCSVYHRASMTKVAVPVLVYLGYAATAYGIASLTTMFGSSIANQSASINQIKDQITYMIDLVNKQEKDGFGKYTGLFTGFKTVASTLIGLIDGMLKMPSAPSDTSQVQNAQKFVESSYSFMEKSRAIIAALDEMQTSSSGVGNFLHGTGLNLGFDLTRWHAFSNTVNKTQDALSLLTSQVQANLESAVKAAQAATPPAGTAPTGGSPVDQLAQLKV